MKNLLLFAFQFIFLAGFSQWSKLDSKPNPLGIENNSEFDAEYTSDEFGNTYYCWTDNRNGKGELFVQKLNKFGEAQWESNGVKVGTVEDAVNYTLTLKSMYLLSSGDLMVAWHKVVNPSSTTQKEVHYNFISASGVTVLAQSKKINVDRVVTNSDVTMGTLAISEVAANKIKVVFNTGLGSGANSIVGVHMDLSGVIEGNWFLIDETYFEGSKVAFDETNKRLIVLINKGFGNYKISSYDKDNQQLFSNDSFIQNPFPGESRFDDFTVVNGQVIIGRTLKSDAGRKVIAQRLDESLNNVWGAGGVQLGTSDSYDIHASLNEDGGGSVAWIEPGAVHRMMSARFNAAGNVLWQKQIYAVQPGKNYVVPNKYASDGKNGLYNLWFTSKSGGYDLSIQHIDGDGNQIFGETGKSITAFNWYGVFRILPHIDGGVIALYSGTNADIGANETYNLYTNYISANGEFGLDQKLAASINKEVYCPQETIVATLEEGNYTATVNQGEDSYTLMQGDAYNEFVLDSLLGDGSYSITFTNQSGLSSEPISFSIQELAKPILSGDILEKCAETDNTLALNGQCDRGNLLWSTAETTNQIQVSPSASTSFTATCSLEGCQTTEPTSIDINVITVNAQANSGGEYNEGQTIELSASGGDTYSWSGPNGFTSDLQNPSIPNALLTHGGSYEVIVGSNAGCSALASTQVTVRKVLGVEKSSLGLKIYPNPASEVLKYAENISIKDVSVINTAGEKFKLYFDKTQRIIKISELSAGAYILRIRNADDSYSFSRFVKI
ncbi:T9SS type A sorting domain-containing protein [uncultured Arcticibacterium sp.]|uniref:T9SS type A sorting domain-containing protein n=1 Tax=uncultured Arcticibacterium sp. TaxID=2173042 RepID=UPI0030F8795D